METVRIADLKNNLSRHLARVRRGGEITVYDRETPIARIVPFVPRAAVARRPAGRDEQAARRLAELARQGVLTPGDPQALAGWLDAHEPVQLPAGSPSALDVLLDMRRDSTR